MKKDEVPQHNAKAFMGRSKALYALAEDGSYQIVPSKGWEAEEIVLDQAVEEFQRLAREAHARAKAGAGSPLEYHMFARRMDAVLLADISGFWAWQVRRHLRPGAFAALPPSKQARYAEALGLPVETLLALPEAP
ncbi:MAG TPA: hypothetical protein VNZ67_05695 [bacterium]|nr:hypothetical protein [bacterium]